MRKKPPINEFRHRPPNAKEIRAATRLAKRVSTKLYEMFIAKKEKDA